MFWSPPIIDACWGFFSVIKVFDAQVFMFWMQTVNTVYQQAVML